MRTERLCNLAQILAICGSLRERSSNRLLIEAAVAIAGNEVVTVYGDLAQLPAFNSDLDADERVPLIVQTFRASVSEARAVLVSVPEYAHGLPGSFKNALDWLVGSTALMDKPVAIWTANTRAEHAPAQLREVLTTMAAIIDEQASLALDVPSTTRDSAELLQTDDVRRQLISALGTLRRSANPDSDSPH